MPAELRRDLDQYPRGAAPKVLVPKKHRQTLALPATSSVGARDIALILQQLVQAQSAHTFGAHYRLEQAGHVFHIVPTEVRDRDGHWSHQASIFAAPISLPAQERPVIDTVNAICVAVGASSHTSVKLLMAPMLMLNNSRTVVGATNESGTSVLTRALTGMNEKLTWRAGYFAQMDSYLLIISVIPDSGSLVTQPVSGARPSPH